MTRLDALAALLAAIEAGDNEWAPEIDLALGPMTDWVFTAMLGSINDAARLEAPLRERGWTSVAEGNGEFYAELVPLAGGKVFGRAPDESRARLSAVIRALIQEEIHP